RGVRVDPFRVRALQCVAVRGIDPADLYCLRSLRGLGIRVGRGQKIQRSASFLLALYAADRCRRRHYSDPQRAADRYHAAIAGSEWDHSSIHPDFHDSAHQPERADGHVHEFACFQRSCMGHHDHHDRLDPGVVLDTTRWRWLNLENLTVGDIANQREVGLQEVVSRQIRALGPLYVAKDAVLDVTFVFANEIETEFDCATALVAMLDAGDLVSDIGIDPKFLFEFTAERLARLFAFFYFSAGKLPFEWHGLVTGALAHQNASPANDQCGCYLLH